MQQLLDGKNKIKKQMVSPELYKET